MCMMAFTVGCLAKKLSHTLEFVILLMLSCRLRGSAGRGNGNLIESNLSFERTDFGPLNKKRLLLKIIQ